MRAHRIPIVRNLCFAVLAALPAAAATAQCPSHSFSVLPPVAGERFGSAVAVVGERAAVGAAGTRTVYPYRYTGERWIGDQPITRPIAGFGEALAMGESHLIIGGEEGVVFIYAAPAPGADEWILEAEIEIPEPRLPSLAMMTGADGAHRAVIASSAVIILRRDGSEWVEETRFDQPLGHVTAHGDTLVVGQIRLGGGGGAYVFQRDGTWRQTAELTEEVPSPLFYASGIALRDDVLAVSASFYGFGQPGDPGGRVYIYRDSGEEWQLEATLEGWASAFGWRLAFAGSRLAVLEGSPPIGLYEPAAGGWPRIDTLNPPAISDLLDLAGDPDGGGLIAGEPNAVAKVGAAHIYSMIACYCRADLTGDGRLDFFDFLEFQALFAAGDLRADFDDNGKLDFFDFLAFQEQFAAGCL